MDVARGISVAALSLLAVLGGCGGDGAGGTGDAARADGGGDAGARDGAPADGSGADGSVGDAGDDGGADAAPDDAGESDASVDGGGADDGGDAALTDAGPGDAAPLDATASDGGPDGGVDGGADAGPMSMPCTAMGACDPFDATSCGAEACRPGAGGVTACGPVDATPAVEGEACALPRECAAGLLCVDFGSGFTCQRMCPDGSIGFCGATLACTGMLGYECIRICRPFPEPCDIYEQDCADPLDTCTLATHPETGAPYTGCRLAGPRARGESCGGAAGTCGHGLICVGATCREVCRPSGDPSCSAAAESCTGLSRTWMVTYCE